MGITPALLISTSTRPPPSVRALSRNVANDSGSVTSSGCPDAMPRSDNVATADSSVATSRSPITTRAPRRQQRLGGRVADAPGGTGDGDRLAPDVVHGDPSRCVRGSRCPPTYSNALEPRRARCRRRLRTTRRGTRAGPGRSLRRSDAQSASATWSSGATTANSRSTSSSMSVVMPSQSPARERRCSSVCRSPQPCRSSTLR